ncbi:hypothetical protein PROFUN_10076 [Planoprotostelium fungivorum]|uniref:VOC domain-containing protein n=1 Tax=Planoprotostelium fungivorum TaxID=1890364 RepID=A0A2P6NEX1_9EUKA|nr:hypothetical protein PROFUN_10076 [Planoprotostelium fungivorum]
MTEHRSLPLHSLNHVSRETRDVDRLRDFYITVLGFRPAVRPNFSFKGHWLLLPHGYYLEDETWHLTKEGRPPGGALLMHIIQKDEQENLPEGPINTDSSYPDRPKAILRGHHLAFRTERMDDVEKILTERGIQFGKSIVPNTSVRQFFFFDPDTEMSKGPIRSLCPLKEIPTLSVGIIGGSLTGLTAALSLERLGVDCRVYERARESKRRGGGGIGVQDVTREDVDEALLPMRVQEEIDRNGRMIRQIPVPMWSAYWQDIDDLLLRNVKEDKVEYMHELIGLNQLENGKVELEFKSGEKREHDAVLACDGGASLVRDLMFPEHLMRFSGYVAWRGTVKTGSLSQSIMRHFCSEFSRNTLSFKISGRQHAVIYYLPPGDIINWIVYLPESEEKYVHRKEAASGMTKDATDEEIQQFLSQVKEVFSQSSLPDIIQSTDKPYKNMIYDSEPLPHLHKGKVLLMGDAAHYSTPHLVKGSNMAIQDGYWISEILERLLSHPHLSREEGLIERWFRIFEERRKRTTEDTVKLGKTRQGLMKEQKEDWDLNCTAKEFTDMAGDERANEE